jgi:serine/threonine protein phosphatase 1
MVAMSGRTFAIGDIHGDALHLERLIGRLPALDAGDTLVFLGDYVDRGPASRQVVEMVRALPARTPAKVVCLRGNHEDAWLRIVDQGWPEYLLPTSNGCLSCLRSFVGADPDAVAASEEVLPSPEELAAMERGAFLPPDVLAWFRELPLHYEDDHAIYVHAGLPLVDGRYLHPREAPDPRALMWLRDRKFFVRYRGKRVVVGHTATVTLPPEYSAYTPEDPADLWAGEDVIAIDTGCGKGGFLTAVELPACGVYESRL